MPKTILQVLPSLVSGGVETGTLDLANELVKQGYRSLVVSSGGPMVKLLEQQGSQHITLPVHSKNPLQIWRNSQLLAKLIHEEKVDLMHVRSRAPAWSVLWASTKTNTPFITTFHGVYGHQNALKRWYNSGMLRGKRTIAVSNYVKQHIDSVYPAYSDKVHLILRGIDLDKFSVEHPLDGLEKLRATWKIPKGSQIIMLPGRLTRLKGHSILIEALSRIRSNNVFCVFVGDEPGKDAYKKELEALVKEKGLSDKVRFTGNYNDMPAAYRLADIVVSASIKPESFGRTACEAQLMQCSVVATNHGGSQETISPAFRPLMCEPRDIDSMTQSLQKALSMSPQEREKSGAAAAEFVRQNFSLEKMCRDTIALYELELSC